MKTFTLRLSDAEAEILERINFLYFGPSKNKTINELISWFYSSVVGDPLYDRSGVVSDAAVLAESRCEDAMLTPEPLKEKAIREAGKFIDYAIKGLEKAEEIKRLEELRKSTILCIGEKKTESLN